MYALVLWKDDKPRTTSVLPLEHVKREEEKVFAKWGEDWYEVDLMLEDDDVAFLNDVPISTNGEFLSRKNINKTPENLIAKKREIKANNRLNNKMVIKNMKKNNKQLFYSSIYSDTSDGEANIGKKTHGDNKKVGGKVVETHEELEKKTETPNEESFHSSSSNSTVQSCAFCECLSTDLPYDEKILKIAEAAANSLSRLVEESGRRMPKSNEVRLHGDYDVMIGRRKLDDILRLNKNKPKNIIRELAKELIGEQKLATLSATAIDEDIVKAIEGCTNRNTHKSNKMSMTQVKRCITLYCGFCKTKLSAKTKLDSGLKSASQENHKNQKPKIKSIKNHTTKVKIVPSTSTESKVLEDVNDNTQDLNKYMEIVEDEKNSDLKNSTLDRKSKISQEFMNEELASDIDDQEVSSREGSQSRSILEEIEQMKTMYSDKKLRKSEEKEREYEQDKGKQDNVSQKHENINGEINRNERKVYRQEREMRHESKMREHEREVKEVKEDRKHESKQENNEMSNPNETENKNDSQSKEKSEFRNERKKFEKKQEVREKSKKREHEREHERREHEREHERREREKECERRERKERKRREREESERREREKRERREREERDRSEREKRERKEREREREKREREKERERREYLKYREFKKIRVSRDSVSRNRSISRKRDGDYKRRERYTSTDHKRSYN